MNTLKAASPQRIRPCLPSRKPWRRTNILIGERSSAGELVVGWARSLLRYAEGGRLPEAVRREEVLGPLQEPVRTPEVAPTRCYLTWEETLSLSRDLVDHVARWGSLPANLLLRGEGRIGLGSMYDILARAYLRLREGEEPDRIELARFAQRNPNLGLLEHQYHRLNLVMLQ